MSFDEETNEHEEDDDTPSVFDVLAEVDTHLADVLDDLDDSTVEDDTQILNVVDEVEPIIATSLDEVADHDDEEDEPVDQDDDDDDDDDDSWSADDSVNDDDDEEDEPPPPVQVEDEYDDDDIEDLAVAALNDPDVQDAFDDSEPEEVVGADAFAAALKAETSIRVADEENKRAEQQRLVDELDHYEHRFRQLQAEVIKESERLQALRIVAAAEKGKQDSVEARIDKSEPVIAPGTGDMQMREWQLDYGPLWGPAGLVTVITVTPQCYFRGEKIMATDSYSTPGYGTRILSVAVGQKIQRAGNDQGTLTAMLNSSSLADAVLHDTAHKWSNISVTVSFVQTCTFDMTIFGRAVLAPTDSIV